MVIVTPLIVKSDPDDAPFLRFIVVAGSFAGGGTVRRICLVVGVGEAGVVVDRVVAVLYITLVPDVTGVGEVVIVGVGQVDVAVLVPNVYVALVVVVVVDVVVVVVDVVTGACVFTQHLGPMSENTFAIVQFDWHHPNSRPRCLDHPLGGSGTACAELNLSNALGPSTSKPRHSL